ncbi:MAG: EAL domain-containing protein [Erysipelotrichaceae bacterium]|nr:EAL domain-containing protein [Erysipelotrichaceae bacterium]
MKTMKKAKKILMAFAGIVIVLSCVLIPFKVTCEDNNTIVVGVPADRCPIFYIDKKSNDITGIGVDLMVYAAKKAGYNVTFKVIQEKSLKDALDNPEYDLLMPFGSAVDSSSGKASIVSDNLMQTPFTLVTKGNSILPSLNSLHVGMLSSLAAGAETVKNIYPGMEISFYENMADCVKALRNGEVDALLHNSYVWSYILQKPAYKDLSVQPAAMFSMDFRVGTLDDPKGQELIAKLNNGIGEIDDTKRQAIILDHTSRKLYQYDLSDYLYQYGMFMLAGALIAVLLAIFVIQRIRMVRKWHEQKMQQMMDHDSLTGLLSMNGFRKRVEELLHKYPDTPYFLSYNNIRDFKFINDSLGREAGDELLKFWAAKSMENLSKEYEAIGRTEGDHFVVLRRIKNDENMTDDVEKVFTPVENYFINQGKDHRVKIISGIYVLTPKDFRKIDVDHMLDLARVAERRIRDNRKSDHEFYNPEQWQKGKRIAEIINYLPSAIEAGDIQVWYQPQIDYAKKKIIGAEALCRWDHTKLGWLYPFDFISTLEEAGLIYDLDSFVWERVCQDLDRWNKQGYRRSVSVNVSRDDIQEGRDICAHFLELIHKYDLSAEQLHIEITETAYVENPAYLIETTEKLRTSGFQVEMDDFGSGYSSLHMLKDVPIDRIKLDLHFLTESGDLEKSRTIVSSMIQMINQLNMEMIAEGVETVEQADFLLSKGCYEMQGYYFHKPMPVQDLEALLEKEK